MITRAAQMLWSVRMPWLFIIAFSKSAREAIEAAGGKAEVK